MSTTPKEISDQHDKTKAEKTQATPSLSQCSTPLIKLIASFLNDREFRNLCLAARGLTYTPCKDDLGKRKKAFRVKKGLLPHVSVHTLENGKPAPIHEFCNSPYFAIDMILTKTPFSEGYYSKKFQEFVCFRKYRNVSALQLAAFSGDKFVLIGLLARLLQKDHEDKYRLIAVQQLTEVHQRITNQEILLDAANAIKEIEFGENDVVKANAKLRLEEIQQSEVFQKQMKEFINEMEEIRRQISDRVKRIQEFEELIRQITGKTTKMQIRETSAPSHHTPELKSETERKVTAENTPIKYADEAEGLEPVLNLLKAYIYYYLQYPQLASQGNWARIDQLWGYVGEWQIRLPHYFKQVFFGDIPFSVAPLPTFENSPSRAICRYWDKAPLNLDGPGLDTASGLYRGPEAGFVVRGILRGGMRDGMCDMTMFAHLYKLCVTGLRNIMVQLSDPKSGNTLESAVSGLKIKP